MKRLLIIAVALLVSAQSQAVVTADNCYVDSQFGNAQFFDAQFFDASCAPVAGPWDLTNIVTGWVSIQTAINDKEFRVHMTTEADGDATWSTWEFGTDITPRGFANIVWALNLIRQEADGNAVWARWDNTGIRNSGNLQIDLPAALTADFVVTP